MDRIKQAVADKVMLELLGMSTIPTLESHEVQIEELTPLELMIRVKVGGEMSRFFKVKISEML